MNLEDYLKKRNMTAYQLSKQSGVSSSTIYYILEERSKIENLSFHSAARIANALDLTMDEFYEAFVSEKN